MGFSVAIASFIVLIGFLSFFATVSTTYLTSIKDITTAATEYTSSQKNEIDTQLQMTVNSVSGNSCNFTVENTGSTTVFLQNATGYNWNSVILSYGNTISQNSYLIENFQVTSIGIIGTNATFDQATHSFINPDEEATILVYTPNGAPQISGQDIVTVTFATYYGVTAVGEAVG